MNTINKRTGELLHNNRKSYLTKYELAMVNSLSDNKLKTYVELYQEIYNVDVHELDPSEVHQITNIVSRLRRKGLKIHTRKSFGVVMKDVICINNSDIRTNRLGSL